MEKLKITIEHPLKTSSSKIAWSMIGTCGGLQKWMADEVTEEVTEEANRLVFKWGEEWSGQDVRHATLITCHTPSSISLQWEEDEGSDYYLEMTIENNDLTRQAHLCLTDRCPPDEEESLRSFWEDSLERLHRASGM